MEVSGFTREELVGAAHNIVRHPDMPEEAFEDLWRTIQRGESWTGVVKNRRKDGGFYWVLANVTPIIERGETVCYASVRVKPTRAQIEGADAAYRQLRAGTARGFRLSRGQVKPTGLRGVLARLKIWRLTGVRSRMLAWAMLASALFLGAAGVALYGMLDRMSTEEIALAAAMLAGGVILIFASGWGFARSITGLLVTATDFTRQIAAGNLSTPLPPASIRDEIGGGDQQAGDRAGKEMCIRDRPGPDPGEVPGPGAGREHHPGAAVRAHQSRPRHRVRHRRAGHRRPSQPADRHRPRLPARRPRGGRVNPAPFQPMA